MIRSDRALNKMVRTLLSMPQDHFDSVMESLDGQQRARILGVIEDIRSEEDRLSHSHALELPFSAFLLPADLSPWLAFRLNGNPRAGDEVFDSFSMTSDAFATLRECANALALQTVDAPPPPSLFSQLLSRFDREASVT
jgi:hypothetical protein